MNIRVIYSTQTLSPNEKFVIGGQFEKEFISVEDAKAAGIPNEYCFAFIGVEGGTHVWSPATGWEFHETGESAAHSNNGA